MRTNQKPSRRSVGARASVGVFGPLIVPVAWVFSLFGAADKVGTFTWPLLAQKAVVGALAGGLGAYLGNQDPSVKKA